MPINSEEICSVDLNAVMWGFDALTKIKVYVKIIYVKWLEVWEYCIFTYMSKESNYLQVMVYFDTKKWGILSLTKAYVKHIYTY